MLFYACELGLGLDIGDSFRAVAGLGLGYFARIFIPIEQLVRYLIVCMRCVCVGGGVRDCVCLFKTGLGYFARIFIPIEQLVRY